MLCGVLICYRGEFNLQWVNVCPRTVHGAYTGNRLVSFILVAEITIVWKDNVSGIIGRIQLVSKCEHVNKYAF